MRIDDIRQMHEDGGWRDEKKDHKKMQNQGVNPTEKKTDFGSSPKSPNVEASKHKEMHNYRGGGPGRASTTIVKHNVYQIAALAMSFRMASWYFRTRASRTTFSGPNTGGLMNLEGYTRACGVNEKRGGTDR